MSLTVWASQANATIRVCQDARVRDGNGNVASHDTEGGQAGWDMGINYNTLDDLLQQLRSQPMPRHVQSGPGGQRTIQPGMITRLAINAHGNIGGLIEIEGPQRPLTIENMMYFQSNIAEIRPFLSPDAVVIFAGCAMAQNDAGTNLLNRLSSDSYFGGCRVVGFTMFGAHYGQTRPALWPWDHSSEWAACSMPGMRVTNNANTTVGPERDHSGGQLPWGSEYSPHAKVSLRGQLIRDADAWAAAVAAGARAAGPGNFPRSLDGLARTLRQEIADQERYRGLLGRRGSGRRGRSHEGRGQMRLPGPQGAHH